MEELARILHTHVQKYPQMKPQDVIKLIYQNEFGPGHAMNDKTRVLLYLLDECADVEGDEDLFVPIGNHLVRVNIFKAAEIYSPEAVSECFIRTADIHRGSMTEYLRKLKFLQKHEEEFGFSFSHDELTEFLAIHRSSAYPSVHHSKEYRSLYLPHYRVIRENMLDSYLVDITE